MSIKGILDRKGADVVTIGASSTVKSAADEMRARRISALVVQTNGRVLGLVTDRDIVDAISRHGAAALLLPVSDILAQGMITVRPADTAKQAMNLMTRHRVRHLPVLADGALAGIVSIGDVVKDRLDDLELESNVLRDLYIAAR
jgi:CBS domain-containing protein